MRSEENAKKRQKRGDSKQEAEERAQNQGNSQKKKDGRNGFGENWEEGAAHLEEGVKIEIN